MKLASLLWLPTRRRAVPGRRIKGNAVPPEKQCSERNEQKQGHTKETSQESGLQIFLPRVELLWRIWREEFYVQKKETGFELLFLVRFRKNFLFGATEMATLSNLDTSASVYQSSQLLNCVYLNLSPNENGNQMLPMHTQQTPQQITTAAIQKVTQSDNYGNTGDLWINPHNNLNHLNLHIMGLITLLLLLYYFNVTYGICQQW